MFLTSRVNPSSSSSAGARRLPPHAALTVLALAGFALLSGCGGGLQFALPILPPAPVRGGGAFQIDNTQPPNNFPVCTVTITVSCRNATGQDVLPNAFLNSLYTTIIVTTGGTLPVQNCSLTGAFPPGLAAIVNPANNTQCLITGTITGLAITPGSSQQFTFSVRASDSSSPAQTDTQDVVINVFAGFSFTITALPNATRSAGAPAPNRTYSVNFTTNLSATIGVPPMATCTGTIGGVAFPTGGFTVAPSGNNCVLSSTNVTQAAGTFTVVMNGLDSGGNTSTVSLQLIVNPELRITTLASAVLDGVANRTYSFSSFVSTGGQAPVALSSTGLGAGACTGLSMNAAGVVSGTPTTAGTCNFTVTATDTTTVGANGGAPAGTFPLAVALTIRNEFAITPPVYVDGVEGRTYGIAPLAQFVVTNLLAAAGASDFGQTAENGNGPIAACAVTAVTGGTLTVANITAVPDATANQCRLQSVGSFPAGTAGTYQVTVQITDNGITSANVAVPAGVRTNTATLIIQPALAVVLTQASNATPAASLHAGVDARSYGIIGAPPTFTASGGLGPAANYRWCVTAGDATFRPAGFTSISNVCGTASTTTGATALYTAALVAAPGGIPSTGVTVQLDDIGNAAVPAATGSATASTNLTILAALSSTLTQTGNATPNTALFNAIDGRSYGIIGAAPTYTAAGGTGTGTYRWCVTTGDATLRPRGFSNISAVCGAASTTTTDTALYTAAAVSGGVLASTPFTVQLDDLGNPAVPDSATAAASFNNASAIAINAAPTVAVTQAPTGAIASGGNFFDAVNGREYASTPAFSPAAPLYTAAGGAGLGFYSWCATGLPAGFTGISACPTFTTVDTVTLSAATVTQAAGAASIVMTLQDAGNPAVPAGGAVTHTANFTIFAALTNTLSQAGGNPGAVPLLDGVDQRDYATGPLAAAAPTSTAAGGLAPYTFCVNGTLPTGFAGMTACGTLGAGFTLSAAPVNVPGGGSFPGIFTTAQDTSNPAVPASTADSVTTGITIQPALTLTEPLGDPLPFGVDQRSYGTAAGGCTGPSAPACDAVVYTASGGLTPYTFSGAFPANTLTCSAAGVNPRTCSAATITSGAVATTTVPITVQDAGNAAVPIGAGITVNRDFTVLAALSYTWTQTGLGANPATLLDAVHNRTYGEITAGSGAPIYTAAGGTGTGTYRWCLTGPTAVAFNAAGLDSISLTCGSGSATVTDTTVFATTGSAVIMPGGTGGPAAVTVRLDDLGNASVPDTFTVGAGFAQSSSNITVNQLLNIQNITQAGATLPNLHDAVSGRSYGVINLGAGAPSFDAFGGLGGATGLNYRWCLTGADGATLFARGFASISATCGPGSATSGLQAFFSAATVSGAALAASFQVQLDDAGNAAVQDSLAAGESTFTSLNININDPLAVALSQDVNAGPAIAQLLDAVDGRTYGEGAQSAGAPTYTASGGFGIAANYNWCVTTGDGTLRPRGFDSITDATSCDPTAGTQTTGTTAVYTTTGAAVSGGALAVTAFTVQLNDEDPTNTAVPNSFTSATFFNANSSIRVNAALSAALAQTGNPTPSNPAQLLDAVDFNGAGTARSYGVVGGTPTYTASGGTAVASPAGYRWCVTTGDATLRPIGFDSISNVCGAASTTTGLNAFYTAAAVNNLNNGLAVTAFDVVLDDLGNAAVPPSTSVGGASFTRSSSIQVNQALSGNFSQSAPGTLATLLPAAVGRDYGVGAQAGGAPNFDAFGGTGAGTGLVTNYRWCATGADAAALSARGFNSISLTCGAGSTTSNTPATYVSSAVVTAGATGVFNFQIELDDNGNAAVPASRTVAGQTFAFGASSIEIFPALVNTLAQNDGSSAIISNPAAIHAATNGSDYGEVAVAPFIGAAPILYNANDPVTFVPTGLPPYTWCVDNSGAGGAGTANLPAGLVTNDPVGPPVVADTAVPLCSVTTLPANFLSLSTELGGATPITQAAGTYPVTTRVFDTGNAAVAPASALSVLRNIVVNGTAPTTITLQQNDGLGTVVNDPPTLHLGVNGRTYGINFGTAFTTASPVVYVHDGAGSFNWCVISGTTFPTGFTHAGSAVPSCPSFVTATSLNITAPGAGITGAAGNYTGIQVRLLGTNNPAVAGTGDIDSALTDITVNNPLATEATQDGVMNPASFADAVVSRSYGTAGSGLLNGAILYDALDGGGNPTGAGLGTYRWCFLNGPHYGLAGTPAISTNCLARTATDSFTLTSGAATGVPSTNTANIFDVSLADVGNAAVGAALATNHSTPMIARPEITITPPTGFPNGMLGAAYPSTGTVQFTAADGLTAANAEQWFIENAPDASVGAVCTLGGIGGGNSPAGLSIAAANGVLSGTITEVSTVGADFIFNACVDDQGNIAVPRTAVTAAIATPLNVFNRYIYTLDDDNNNVVHVIDSSTNSYVDVDGGTGGDQGIALGAGTNPFQVAVSPHGRYAWVTQNGNNQVRVIDTITHAIVATLDTTTGTADCDQPNGIAAQRTPQGDRVVVSCDDAEVIVLVDPGPSATPTTAGMTSIVPADCTGALDSVAFNAAGTRAYFTDATNNRFCAIDTSVATPVQVDISSTAGQHVSLTGVGSEPRGIIVVTNGANQYAYIVKRVKQGTDFFVQVFNVTAVTAAAVTDVNIGDDSGGDRFPRHMAFDSTNNVVYVTQNGTDELIQINNGVATPTSAGAGVAATGDQPFGIAIAPISGRVFSTTFATSNRVDFFTLTAFGVNPSGAGNVDLSGVTNATPVNQGRGATAIQIPK
jgi:hypothetical protein